MTTIKYNSSHGMYGPCGSNWFGWMSFIPASNSRNSIFYIVEWGKIIIQTYVNSWEYKRMNGKYNNIFRHKWFYIVSWIPEFLRSVQNVELGHWTHFQSAKCVVFLNVWCNLQIVVWIFERNDLLFTFMQISNKNISNCNRLTWMAKKNKKCTSKL